MAAVVVAVVVVNSRIEFGINFGQINWFSLNAQNTSQQVGQRETIIFAVAASDNVVMLWFSTRDHQEPSIGALIWQRDSRVI